MRVFISIKLPTKVLLQVKNIQDSLPEFIGKRTELKNIHLTLKFLGEISSQKLEEVKCKLKDINLLKFEVELGEVGFFEKKQRGIIWASLSNCGCLQREIDKLLEGLFDKETRFMGHITIARFKEVKNKKAFIDCINNINVPKIFFTVDRFYLVESKLKKEGPEYFVLDEYILR